MQTFQLVPDPASVNGRVNVWQRDMRFTPDGRYLYVANDSLNFLDTRGDRPPAALPKCVYGFANNGELGVGRTEHGDGERLLTVNLRTGESVTRELKGRAVSHGAVTAAGELFYVAVWPTRPKRLALHIDLSEIRVFTAASLEPLRTFGRCEEQFYGVALSASGNRLAVGDYHGFQVWNVTSPRARPVRIRRGNVPNGFALSNDGSRFVDVDRSGLTIWDAATGELVVHSSKHRRTVTAVACSPTKPLLATGDNAGNVLLWDYTGRVLARFDWGLGGVCAMCFAPDGFRCAAVDAKGKVVVWDVDA
jgi:WD40 repeat protein